MEMKSKQHNLHQNTVEYKQLALVKLMQFSKYFCRHIGAGHILLCIFCYI